MKSSELKQLIKEEIISILREEEDWFAKKYPPKKLTPREKLDLMGGTFLDKVNSMRDMDYDQLTALRDHPLFSKHFQSKKYEIGGYISMAKKTGKTYNDQIKDRGLNEDNSKLTVTPGKYKLSWMDDDESGVDEEEVEVTQDMIDDAEKNDANDHWFWKSLAGELSPSSSVRVRTVKKLN